MGFDNTLKVYYGSTEDFKTRYANHKSSFKNEGKKNSTELSKLIWKLKNMKKTYGLKWEIAAKG